MPVYQCKAIDKGGKTVNFIQEALSEDIIVRELSTKGLFPVQIIPAEGREKSGRVRRLISKNSRFI